MDYQAKNSDDPAALPAWQAWLEGEAKLAQSVRDFCLENPPSAKYQRKGLIQRAQFKRRYGIVTKRRERAGCVPMTKEEYVHWMTETKRVPKPEAESHWKSFEDDPAVDRDTDGIGGRQQLWIPNAFRSREFFRDKFVESAQEEGEIAPVEPGAVVGALMPPCPGWPWPL